MSYSEEFSRCSRVDGAVLDFGLFGEVFGRLDRRLHSLDGQKRRQVGGVRRDDDQSEEPPDATDDPSRHRPAQKHHRRPHMAATLPPS